MTDLWVLCEHGEKGKHQTEWSYDGSDCPGGHVATVEEVVEWLKPQGLAVVESVDAALAELIEQLEVEAEDV